MDHSQFYRNLPVFTDFSNLVDESCFVEAPDSWFLVLSDVRGSTKAIQEGRYQDVNLIGAASITCVLNVLNSQDFPFVFGGDGATMLVPGSRLDEVISELKQLQMLSIKKFNLELRVGTVSIEKLHQLGAFIKVGKYQLSPGNFIAQFKGGGLNLAEEMIKNQKPQGAKLHKAEFESENPNLTGLSCRLKPMISQKGKIVCLLIKPNSENIDQNKNLEEILIQLKRILNNDFLSARPINSQQLKWSWPHKSLWKEIVLQKNSRNIFIASVITGLKSLIATFSLSLNIPLGPFKPATYKEELLTNSDFKKFDDMLRMVIDCTSQQEIEIKKLLELQKQQRKIFYGIHTSEQALMTCMVQSASENQHIHFIDGGSGGYALAAIELKAQLKQ